MGVVVVVGIVVVLVGVGVVLRDTFHYQPLERVRSPHPFA